MIGKLPRFLVSDPRYPNAKQAQVILYVPKSLKPDHPLVSILGWHDASRLVNFFGGEILKPGNCNDIYRRFRDRSILRMAGEGMKPPAIAELMSVSDRHVRNLIRENPQEGIAAANDNTAATQQPKQARR